MNREATLNAALLATAVLVALAPRPAAAGTLVTGVIRDRSGAAAAGARVTAFDVAGAPVGADVASSDGTFALDAKGAPVAIAIVCDYCRAVRRPIDPAQPVIVIVDRFAAVAGIGPSAEDLRALPYRSAVDVASLRPFTVVRAGTIADRGLDYEGAVLVDGLPFYRAADGEDFSGLIPAHGVAALSATTPLAAPLYGGYAAAGRYDLRLVDSDLTTSRLETGDASDAALRFAGARADGGFVASSDTGESRQAGFADVALPLGGGRLTFDGVAMGDSSANASGAALEYATDSRRFSTAATLSATQGSGAALISASARLQNHGPLGLEFGLRATRTTADAGGLAGSQFDAALYAAATRQSGANTFAAAAAWDRGTTAVAGGTPTAGLLGSLSDDLRLDPSWTAHAGVVSNLRPPAFGELSAAAPLAVGGDRSLLFEGALTFADLRRLRLTGLAYTQRSTGTATGSINGVGIDAAWQIAPQLALRTWLLRANQTSIAPDTPALTGYSSPAGPYSAPAATTATGALTRQLLWLTYGTGVRVDALVRGGPLEGDVRVPMGERFAITVGSAEYAGRRVTTLGLTRR